MTAVRAREAGSALVEVVAVASVVGALLALGMPGYVLYTEDGHEAQCAKTRHTLEAAERACAIDDDGRPCLTTRKLVSSGYLGAAPTCASGGTYVWIAAEAGEPDYPKVGCSKHYFPSAAASR